MAYADARHTQRNAATFAAVTLIEAGLTVAIVLGLSTTITNRPDPRTITFDVPPPTIEQPKVKPTPEPDTPRVIDRPPVTRDPPLDTGLAGGTVIDTGTDTGTGETIREVVFPTPTPSPEPSFTPIKARPRGNPANWVTTDDYPTSAIRQEQEGRTGFRLSIDAAGKVTDCEITASSGSATLDEATCAKLSRRARFEPATGRDGEAVAGSYTSSVLWRLPKD